ncbi:MAG: hypothetical protein HY720_28755 [Planctomycetes bacterium]|nr:hypothetical protein [Planctomycetota bacterium]
MKRSLSAAVAALLFLALVSCEPPGSASKEDAKSAPAAGKPSGSGSNETTRPQPARAAKAPFDESRIPESLDVAGDRASANAGGEERVPLPEGALALGDRYASAFARLAAASGPARRFDVLSFEPPAGLVVSGLEVDPEGEASLFLSAGDRETHAVRVRILATAAAARDALRAELAGYQATLEPLAVGDIGFVAIREGRPRRILFVSGNLFLQVWALGEESAGDVATAVERHAAAAPEESTLEPLPEAALRAVGPARAGRLAELALETTGVEVVSTHFSAGGDAAVTTGQGRAWLLAPTPGAKEVRAVLFDRWLRRIETRATIDVAE